MSFEEPDSKSGEENYAVEETEIKCAIDDLNQVCKFDPVLDHTADHEMLLQDLQDVRNDIRTSDVLSSSTWRVLQEFNALPDWKQEGLQEKNNDGRKEEDVQMGKAKNTKEKNAKAKNTKEKNAKEKNAKAKNTKEKNARSGDKKIGVIAEIRCFIANQGPVTKDEIHAHLTQCFPDRAEKSLRSTINVQVPNRISKEVGPLVKTAEGGFEFKNKHNIQ